MKCYDFIIKSKETMQVKDIQDDRGTTISKTSGENKKYLESWFK
jgi:hypothetical protein